MNLLLTLFISMLMLAQGPWKAPAAADNLKNPMPGNAEAIKAGKKLYATYCAVCHGDKGKGDGIAGAALTPKPMDFTSEVFANQSDGSVFWKLSNGRTPMASYESSLSEEQRWQLVNYLRTLRK